MESSEARDTEKHVDQQPLLKGNKTTGPEKKEPDVWIAFLGDSGVGKTSLLQQYIDGKVSSMTKPTIGADFLKKELDIDGK